ncbi:hypothetical protein DERP_014072 [Dermatophagoides pteronyssinus]|uniref:Uncharacterized protein n=1 Tax=Dermatophagoides pteronyssinus TaxID=6956 RepID=A0ABQ8J6S3_DERPT|nr:hypothetical protein DERP_014072 [Dermatophagoides pteronyssinus]
MSKIRSIIKSISQYIINMSMRLQYSSLSIINQYLFFLYKQNNSEQFIRSKLKIQSEASSLGKSVIRV